MAVIDGRTWLEHLSPARVLASARRSRPVGRIGVLVDSAPEIYPVNFVVDEETIVVQNRPRQQAPRVGPEPIGLLRSRRDQPRRAHRLERPGQRAAPPRSPAPRTGAPSPLLASRSGRWARSRTGSGSGRPR